MKIFTTRMKYFTLNILKFLLFLIFFLFFKDKILKIIMGFARLCLYLIALILFRVNIRSFFIEYYEFCVIKEADIHIKNIEINSELFICATTVIKTFDIKTNQIIKITFHPNETVNKINYLKMTP